MGDITAAICMPGGTCLRSPVAIVRAATFYRTIEDLEAIRVSAREACVGVVIAGGLLGLDAAKARCDLGRVAIPGVLRFEVAGVESRCDWTAWARRLCDAENAAADYRDHHDGGYGPAALA